jgi:hypothetical protein
MKTCEHCTHFMWRDSLEGGEDAPNDWCAFPNNFRKLIAVSKHDSCNRFHKRWVPDVDPNAGKGNET